MLLVNFSHPLAPAHLVRIAELVGQRPSVLERPIQFDQGQSFADQARSVVDSLGLSPSEWQTSPLLINPPGYAPAAVTLLAELHGRMGYFPPVVRLRPVANSVPQQFEVFEVINLQAVRDEARRRRKP